MENKIPYHVPALLEPCMDGLAIKPEGVYVDATFGGGGHSRAILEQLEGGRLIVLDQDIAALANVPEDPRIIAVHGNFRFIKNYLAMAKYPQVDGILVDLGVSFHQFDAEERGFSFRAEAPLDMRMNTTQGRTAANIVNKATEAELTNLLREWGELTNARQIANVIVKARMEQSIDLTTQLAEILSSFYLPHTKHKFLAQVFQAFRLEVNAEMEVLSDFLTAAYDCLKKGGRLVVITYHSLEDRLVKNFFKDTDDTVSEAQALIYGTRNTKFKLINKKVIIPTEEEIAQNNRARSAKLRIAEKR